MCAWLQIDVFVKNTSTVPSFQMAYTDPTKDVDVSGQMEHGGVVEIGLTMMWYKALKDKCNQRDGSRALVVDVGGNFGWYSIYAATLGCRSALCSVFFFLGGNQGQLLIACTTLASLNNNDHNNDNNDSTFQLMVS